MAQLAFGIAGAAVGAPFGMSSLGFSIGSAIGGALFAETQKFEGPRVGELKATSSTQGAPIPRVYATDALTGNLIWSSDLIETRKTVKSGGKGGGPKAETTTYSYSVDMAVMLCEGPISGVRKMWFNDKLKYDISSGGDISSQAASSAIQASVVVYLGDETQLPDPTIESYEGVGEVPAHRGTAYAVFTGLQLRDYGNARPNIRFEVVSDGTLSDDDGEFIGPLDVAPWDAAPYVNNGVGAVSTTGTIQDVQQAIFENQKVFWPDQLINPQQVRLVDQYVGNDAGIVDDRLSSRIRGRAGDIYREIHSFVLRDDVSNDIQNVNLLPFGVDLDTIPFDQISYVDRFDSTRGPWIVMKIDSLTTAAPLGFHPIPVVANLVTPPFWRLWVVKQFSADVQREIGCRGGCGTGDPCLDDAPVILPEAPQYCIDCTGTVTQNNSGAKEAGSFVQAYELTVTSDADGVQRITQFPSGPVLRATDPNNNPAWWLSQGVSSPVSVAEACVTSLVELELSSNCVALSTIVADICDRAGILSYDVSELTDLVCGYTIARQMQGRKALEPLQRAYFFDAVEDDWTVKFVKRGGSIATTIAADDMGAEEV